MTEWPGFVIGGHGEAGGPAQVEAMALVQNTHPEIGEPRSTSANSARLNAERLRLARASDLIAAEVTHTPKPTLPDLDEVPDGYGRHSLSVVALQGQVAALLGHVDTLMGIAVRAERATAHERLRADVAELRAYGERERANKLADEVAGLGRSLVDLAGAARTHESGLQDRIDRATAQMAELRARSWWRRLAG